MEPQVYRDEMGGSVEDIPEPQFIPLKNLVNTTFVDNINQLVKASKGANHNESLSDKDGEEFRNSKPVKGEHKPDTCKTDVSKISVQ